MHINSVKTAFKIADVSWDGKGPKLSFDYLDDLRDERENPLPQSVLTQNLSRVYLIVVDGIIKKIGCSEDKGGMKGTLRIYMDGGVKGRPSVRSFGIWYWCQILYQWCSQWWLRSVCNADSRKLFAASEYDSRTPPQHQI